MSKFKSPAMQLLVLLGFMLLMVVVANVLAVIPVLLGLDVNDGVGLYFVQSIGQLLMFFVPVLLVARRYYFNDQRGFFRLELNGRAWWMAFVAVFVMVLMAPAIDWLTTWNDSWSFGIFDEPLRHLQHLNEEATRRMLGGVSMGSLFVNVLVVALVPAVCEEVFFRAGIQNLLQRWFTSDVCSNSHWGTHLAVWLTAAIFSLVHAEVYAFMPRFLMGAMLGYLYIYSGSIVVNISAHFINNAIVVVVYWLVSCGRLDIDPMAPLRLPWLLTLCCTIAALLLCWAFILQEYDKKMKISR